MTLGALKPWERPETGKPAANAARFQSLIPVLETERLILRAPIMEDFPAFAEIEMSDRAIYMGGPLNREDTWLDFTQCLASWMLNGYGMWSVTTKDGALQGFVTIVRGYEDLEPELGYFFRAEAEGKGYASEAAKAARDFGIDEIGVGSLVSYIDGKNAASVNVAAKIGGTRDRASEQIFEGTDYTGDVVYRHWPKNGRPDVALEKALG
ncbi:MAG: GNAT family N-acetyltransferase [Litoreibacter sp.]|nr:GNAT family N-acetyltransferase [Litoreibacter sp.]